MMCCPGLDCLDYARVIIDRFDGSETSLGLAGWGASCCDPAAAMHGAAARKLNDEAKALVRDKTYKLEAAIKIFCPN